MNSQIFQVPNFLRPYSLMSQNGQANEFGDGMSIANLMRPTQLII